MSAQISSEDLAYIAGFLDGEGCFHVGPWYWSITVTCENSDRPTMEWLHSLFGGCLRRPKPQKLNHRQLHQWSVVDLDALNVCQLIVPYLRQKTEQALLLIAIQQTKQREYKGGTRLSPAVVVERNRLTCRAKELKHVAWK